MNKKIVLYFGSFNPVHNGHLDVANYMIDSAVCDELWLVVSPSSPHKDSNILIDESHRLKMVELATQEWGSSIITCDIEFKQERPSYTINTITNIINQHSANIDFFLLMGEDNIFTFDDWRRWKDILRLVDVIIYPRDTNCLLEVEDKIKQLCDSGNFDNSKFKYLYDAPIIEISSTKIRELIKSGTTIENYTTQKVIEYITNNKLYKNECGREDNS